MTIQSALPRNVKKPLSREQLSSIDQIVSPRAEFPNRELPKPRGYEGHSAHPHSAHPLNMQKRIPSPPLVSALPNQKSQFMSVFEQMYDAHESTSRMQQQLKEQIRKSATLLYTLSSSGQMIEGLVRSHFREMQGQYLEKFAHALTDLNRRLVSIEQRTLGKSQSEAFTAAGGLKLQAKETPTNLSPNGNAQKQNAFGTTLPSIVDRLEAIERNSPPKS